MDNSELSMKYICPDCGNRYIKVPLDRKCLNCDIPVIDIATSL